MLNYDEPMKIFKVTGMFDNDPRSGKVSDKFMKFPSMFDAFSWGCDLNANLEQNDVCISIEDIETKEMTWI